jgi:hypothetical protein
MNHSPSANASERQRLKSVRDRRLRRVVRMRSRAAIRLPNEPSVARDSRVSDVNRST